MIHFSKQKIYKIRFLCSVLQMINAAMTRQKTFGSAQNCAQEKCCIGRQYCVSLSTGVEKYSVSSCWVRVCST